jgi:hypothetical protein
VRLGLRHYMKEVSWLVMGLLFTGGLIVGLMFGYWPLRNSQNNIQEQLNRIEQYQAAQQQPAPASAAPEPHAPAHKGKMK